MQKIFGVKSVKNIDSEVLLFFGRETIFSNFHLSTFTDGKRSFNCVEQYFQYSKAGICGQHQPPDTNQPTVTLFFQPHSPMRKLRQRSWLSRIHEHKRYSGHRSIHSEETCGIVFRQTSCKKDWNLRLLSEYNSFELYFT